MRSKDLFRRGRSPSQSSSHDCDARNRRRRRYASSSAPWHALLPQRRRCGVAASRALVSPPL